MGTSNFKRKLLTHILNIIQASVARPFTMRLLLLCFLLAMVDSGPMPEDVHLHFHLGEPGRMKNVGGDFAPTEVGADYAGNKKGPTNVCMHPWGGWSYPLGGYGECGNPERPCDLCACKPGNPPKLKIDRNGCKKGPLCQKPCPSSEDDHRVGDSWDCWHDDKRCMAQCECTGSQNGGTRLRIQFGPTCKHHITTKKK